MEAYLSEYLPIAVFMAIAIGLSVAFVIGAFVVGSQKPDIEKLTAYECGFDAFDDSRKPFDVRFYLVAILFIIFDLEIAFLFLCCFRRHRIVWLLVNDVFGCADYGFIYEWKKELWNGNKRQAANA